MVICCPVAQMTALFDDPPLRTLISMMLKKAVPFTFFATPPPESATAVPNTPNSSSSMGMILAINNRDDIEVFFKLKFLLSLFTKDTKR